LSIRSLVLVINAASWRAGGQRDLEGGERLVDQRGAGRLADSVNGAAARLLR